MVEMIVVVVICGVVFKPGADVFGMVVVFMGVFFVGVVGSEVVLDWFRLALDWFGGLWRHP